MDNNELYHHGVKGQKWGVRRYQNKDGSLIHPGKKRSIKTIKDTISKKKKKHAKEKKQKAEAERQHKLESGKLKAKKMTDAELKDKIARLELEKKYNELVKSTTTVSRGKRFTEKFKDSAVDKLADNVSADLVAQLAKAVAAKGINKATSKYFDGDIVFANNKKKS